MCIRDRTIDGEWIFTDHLALVKGFQLHGGDLTQIAEIYLGTAYLYGGRSGFGIDCTGLVQQCLRAAGHPCPPRDSGDQEGSFGKEVKIEDIQRNDVVYFKGHVGIMIDSENILNATARHMTTLIEPLKTLEKDYGGITHIARV